MLLLERRRGESVAIGDAVEVEVREIGRSAIQLAIRAPRELLVLRGEVTDRGISPPLAHARSAPLMLLVRRRLGESLRIGPEIEVTPLRIRSSHVRLAILAPQNMRIRRSGAGARAMAPAEISPNREKSLKEFADAAMRQLSE